MSMKMRTENDAQEFRSTGNLITEWHAESRLEQICACHEQRVWRVGFPASSLKLSDIEYSPTECQVYML